MTDEQSDEANCVDLLNAGAQNICSRPASRSLDNLVRLDGIV